MDLPNLYKRLVFQCLKFITPQNGMFKTTSDYFTTSDEDTREVMSVTETEPLAGDYISNGHVVEREADKENIGAAAKSGGGTFFRSGRFLLYINC